QLDPPEVAAVNQETDLLDLADVGLSLEPATGLQSGGTLVVHWTDSATGNVAAMASFTDTATVKNLRTGESLFTTSLSYNPATPGAWTDGVVAKNLTTGVQFLSTSLSSGSGQLPAAQSRGRQFTLRLPDGAPGVGPIEFTITADTFQNVFEYNAGGTAENDNK